MEMNYPALVGDRLVAPPRQKVKRVGRGIGSKLGKTSGRGMNGQRARSGGRVRIGFEGGQMPLYRRLPRRGFSNTSFKMEYQTIALRRIVEIFDSGDSVTIETLRKKGVVKNNRRVKIVSGIAINIPLRLELGMLRASKTVIAAIKECGGSVIGDNTESSSMNTPLSNQVGSDK